MFYALYFQFCKQLNIMTDSVVLRVVVIIIFCKSSSILCKRGEAKVIVSRLNQNNVLFVHPGYDYDGYERFSDESGSPHINEGIEMNNMRQPGGVKQIRKNKHILPCDYIIDGECYLWV